MLLPLTIIILIATIVLNVINFRLIRRARRRWQEATANLDRVIEEQAWKEPWT